MTYILSWHQMGGTEKTMKTSIGFPYFLNNRRITDGGEVVRLTFWQPFTPRKIPNNYFW
jgi:hypothetical protein